MCAEQKVSARSKGLRKRGHAEEPAQGEAEAVAATAQKKKKKTKKRAMVVQY
jgi:hypothetical protein